MACMNPNAAWPLRVAGLRRTRRVGRRVMTGVGVRRPGSSARRVTVGQAQVLSASRVARQALVANTTGQDGGQGTNRSDVARRQRRELRAAVLCPPRRRTRGCPWTVATREVRDRGRRGTDRAKGRSGSATQRPPSGYRDFCLPESLSTAR